MKTNINKLHKLEAQNLIIATNTCYIKLYDCLKYSYSDMGLIKSFRSEKSNINKLIKNISVNQTKDSLDIYIYIHYADYQNTKILIEENFCAITLKESTWKYNFPDKVNVKESSYSCDENLLRYQIKLFKQNAKIWSIPKEVLHYTDVNNDEKRFRGVSNNNNNEKCDEIIAAPKEDVSIPKLKIQWFERDNCLGLTLFVKNCVSADWELWPLPHLSTSAESTTMSSCVLKVIIEKFDKPIDLNNFIKLNLNFLPPSSSLPESEQHPTSSQQFYNNKIAVPNKAYEFNLLLAGSINHNTVKMSFFRENIKLNFDKLPPYTCWNLKTTPHIVSNYDIRTQQSQLLEMSPQTFYSLNSSKNNHKRDPDVGQNNIKPIFSIDTKCPQNHSGTINTLSDPAGIVSDLQTTNATRPIPLKCGSPPSTLTTTTTTSAESSIPQNNNMFYPFNNHSNSCSISTCNNKSATYVGGEAAPNTTAVSPAIFSINNISSSSSHHNNNNNTPNQSSFKKGYCGLMNLGNTCFMNCVIQILANTKPFRDYFLEGSYTKELNTDNPLGLNGELALAFAELLRDMWAGNFSSVSPFKLKSLISVKANQFIGYSQHDAQEFLAFLLDGLHEDLNRVKNKPYTAQIETNGKSDVEIADETWVYYKSRNDSYINELFLGQYKSLLTCPECKLKSTTFDPLLYMTLPLPEKCQPISVYYFPYVSPSTQQTSSSSSYTSSDRPLKFIFRVPHGTKVSKIAEKIEAHTKKPATDITFIEVEKSRFLKRLNSEDDITAQLNVHSTATFSSYPLQTNSSSPFSHLPHHHHHHPSTTKDIFAFQSPNDPRNFKQILVIQNVYEEEGYDRRNELQTTPEDSSHETVRCEEAAIQQQLSPIKNNEEVETSNLFDDCETDPLINNKSCTLTQIENMELGQQSLQDGTMPSSTNTFLDKESKVFASSSHTFDPNLYKMARYVNPPFPTATTDKNCSEHYRLIGRPFLIYVPVPLIHHFTAPDLYSIIEPLSSLSVEYEVTDKKNYPSRSQPPPAVIPPSPAAPAAVISPAVAAASTAVLNPLRPGLMGGVTPLLVFNRRPTSGPSGPAGGYQIINHHLSSPNDSSPRLREEGESPRLNVKELPIPNYNSSNSTVPTPSTSSYSNTSKCDTVAPPQRHKYGHPGLTLEKIERDLGKRVVRECFNKGDSGDVNSLYSAPSSSSKDASLSSPMETNLFERAKISTIDERGVSNVMIQDHKTNTRSRHLDIEEVDLASALDEEADFEMFDQEASAAEAASKVVMDYFDHTIANADFSTNPNLRLPSSSPPPPQKISSSVATTPNPKDELEKIPVPFNLRLTSSSLLRKGSKPIYPDDTESIDLSDVDTIYVDWNAKCSRTNTNLSNEQFYEYKICEKNLDHFTHKCEDGCGNQIRCRNVSECSNPENMMARLEEMDNTLQNCLKLFSKKEILTPEEAWYCPNCKKHTQAEKTMSLWKFPKILVIIFKRFAYGNHYWREKLDKLITFPLENLDLSNIYEGPSPSKPIYDLYGVINHQGTLHGGHYTSYARILLPPPEKLQEPFTSSFPTTSSKNTDDQFEEKGWRYFDDSSVSDVYNENSIVSPSSYVLFYKVRE